MIEAAADHAGTLTIFAASLLGGVVLGLRFRVLILVPVIIVGIVLIAVAGIGLRAAVWPIVTAVVVNAVGVQVGYLLGSFRSCRLIARRRARRDRLPTNPDNPIFRSSPRSRA